MAQKVKPNALRLGITIPWSSRWFFKRANRFFLEEDHEVRRVVRKRVLEAGIAAVDIERTANVVRVNIHAARPGLIIGRGGKGIDDLKRDVLTAMKALRAKNKVPGNFLLNLNIEELRRNEMSAPVVAQQIAYDLQKRLPYRRVLKRAVEQMMQNQEVKGAKVRVSGRLNGAEISRADWLAQGRMPLQTLRAHIDYGEATAFNSYGTVGIKVWMYKGEVFDRKPGTREPRREE